MLCKKEDNAAGKLKKTINTAKRPVLMAAGLFAVCRKKSICGFYVNVRFPDYKNKKLW